ncbi:MAG: twin-arginine translocase TatA/TatE family subunit [Gemmatimonadetes bacterium]|nr:twin-arginine translocase TatA/TatE family subunit [Gemmatimonadota bacterium]
MPFNLGFSELLVILLIVLLVFGAKRLPEMGAAMGKGIREFKKSLRDVQSSIEGGGNNEELPPAHSSRQLDEATKPGGEPKKLSQ